MLYKFRKMYIPALTIVAVILLLLILISVSTYRNLDRDRRKAISFLQSQGTALIHSLEAVVKVGLGASSKKGFMGNIIREIAKSDDIAYIYFIDSRGEVIHYSGSVQVGDRFATQNIFPHSDRIYSMVRKISKEIRVYELTKSFLLSQLYQTTEYKNEPANEAIVLGLKMKKFEEAQKADLHHAVIMAGILVALGSGILFFIFVIQNYYLVDKTLKETQDYTRQVVAKMANGLLSINAAGELVSYNKLALSLLGLEVKEALGMDLRTVMDFEATGISETLSQSRSILDREFLYHQKSGVSIPLSLSVTPLMSEDRIISGAVIVLRDLREIKRLQEKVQRSEKLATIGELAAGVAHEIRNPLSSIKGFAQFLNHALKDRPEEREYTTVMVREIERINRVVTDLLIYARPLRARRRDVDIRDLTEHAILLVNADALNKKVVIRQNISGKLDNIWLDDNQMTHALLNLLLNSLEAVSTGGEIEIGAQLIDGSQKLHLWVEDDGIGIPVEYQEKIMSPFFTSRDKGTGLGLAIAHKIAEIHGGEIHVESPPQGKERGTRVSLCFPLSSSYLKKGIE